VAKAIYICFVKWSMDAYKKWGADPEYFNKNWMPKHDELMKKHGLKLAYNGTPFGLPEDACMVYEGGSDADKYKQFRQAVAAITPGILESANTIIVSL